jgi:tetratricopeptide (TPR) repeat protein
VCPPPARGSVRPLLGGRLGRPGGGRGARRPVRRGARQAGQKATDRATKIALFTRGQETAERAIALDDQLVDAHYGRFCNLGESLRVDGEKITSVFKLRDLMNELDKTLALDPNHVEALATKGALLVQLPRMFGGDVPKGEQMLKKVVRLDDNAVTSRIVLAKACMWRGDTAEGVAYAQRALQIAKDEGRADKVAEAQAVLADLGAKP